MSLGRLRASLSLLLLLLGGGLHEATRRDRGAAGSAVQPVPTAGSSGRFVSPEHHECTWQLLSPVPGATAGSELALRCRSPDGARSQCAYRGQPERCAAFGARRPHYWKQLLGALRRRRRPCHDPAPLQARLCAGRKGRGSELHLVTHATLPTSPTAAGFPGESRLWARNRGRPRQPAPGPAAQDPPPQNAQPREKPSGRKTRGGKRKVVSEPAEERPMATGPNPDPLDRNAELPETYCAEKWHSLCNFFVNFWNG